MYPQVPIARSQIRSLRSQAQAAAELAKNSSMADRIGHVLTSVMLAGFSLELGLKIFWMTYYDKPKVGHDLNLLFFDLPDQIRGDISESFLASKFDKPDIELIALKTSPDQRLAPSTPETIESEKYETAEDIICSSSTAFIKARYFFERVGGEDWSIISNPVHYMLALSIVLDVVYDEYVRRGGWA